jgi:hypothetical protein
MSPQLMILDAAWFQEALRPALSAAWLERSFAPCQRICQTLVPRSRALALECRLGEGELLLPLVAQGLAFDRHFWPMVTWECLFFGAAEVAHMQVPQQAYFYLLSGGPQTSGPRSRACFTPIEQAVFGTSDLTFGRKFYRPLRAGFSGLDQVGRLAAYLEAQQPQEWRAEQLLGMQELLTDDDREEELAFAREWFPSLVEWYRRAFELRGVVISDSV